MNKTLFVFLLLIVTAFSLSAKHHKGDHPGKGMKGPMHAKMLEKIDTDKDGKISKQEWQTHHDQKFTELDTDKDGAISHDEFKEFDFEKLLDYAFEHCVFPEGHSFEPNIDNISLPESEVWEVILPNFFRGKVDNKFKPKNKTSEGTN